MEKYEIIRDVHELHRFIEWLPELKKRETYYLTLFARSKYDPTGMIKSDKSQLKTLTTDKSRMVHKIRQLEIEVGAYGFEFPVHPDSVALYIGTTPRDMEKASRRLAAVLAEKLYREYDGFNPAKVAMTCIQEELSKKRFTVFDIDGAGLDQLPEMLAGKINIDACDAIQTRGGVHLIVHFDRVASEYRNKWHIGLSGLSDQISSLSPVPGCVQGGFVPRLVSMR